MSRAGVFGSFIVFFLAFVIADIPALAGERKAGPEAVLLSKKLTGSVNLKVDDSGNAAVSIGGRDVDVSQLIKLKFSDADKSRRGGEDAVEIHYANGDVLLGTYDGGGDESIKFSTSSLSSREEFFEDLRAVFFPERIPRNVRGFRESCLKKRGHKDDLIFLTAEPENPSVVTISAFASAGIRAVKEGFGNEIYVDLSRISAIVLYKEPEKDKGKDEPEKDDEKDVEKDNRGPRITTYLLDGSRLSGNIVSLDARNLKMTWRDGNLLTIPVSDVGTIYFHNPNYVFLSDLDPSEVNECLYFQKEQEWPWRRDRSVKYGQRLRIRGQTFQKGLGVHSKSVLTYKLDGKYSVFMATIGLDDEIEKEANEGREGNVDFRVVGDGKVLFEAKGITVLDQPKIVRVSLTGVKQLALVVDFGKNFHVQDRADWAEPILIRKK